MDAVSQTGFLNITAVGNYSFNHSAWRNDTEPGIKDLPREWVVILGMVAAVAIAVLGVLGNGVTIAAYYRNRKLQTSFNHLITNLCAVDLTFSILALPLILPLISTRSDLYPREICTFVAYIYYSLMSSSVINLVCIAINRYVGIVHSSRYRTLFSKDMIKWWLLGVWILAPALYLPFVLTDTFVWRTSSYRCALSTSHFDSKVLKLYQIVINVLLQFVPTIALIVLYRAILCKVKKCRKSVEKHPAPVSVSPSCADREESAFASKRRRCSKTQAPTCGSPSQICSSPVEQKCGMNYLQVPPGKLGNLGLRRGSLGFTRNGRRLNSPSAPASTTMSSPDLLSGDDESECSIRSEAESIRRKSWGDESYCSKREAFQYPTEHKKLSCRSSRAVTILSTIDSEPNSKSEPTDDVTMEIARDIILRKSRKSSMEREDSKENEKKVREDELQERYDSSELNVIPDQVVSRLKLLLSSGQIRRQPSMIRESPEEEENDELDEKDTSRELTEKDSLVDLCNRSCKDCCDDMGSTDKVESPTIKVNDKGSTDPGTSEHHETLPSNNEEHDHLPQGVAKEGKKVTENCDVGNNDSDTKDEAPAYKRMSVKKMVFPVSRRFSPKAKSTTDKRQIRAQFQDRRAKSETWKNPRQSWKRYCSQHKAMHDIEIVIEHFTMEDAQTNQAEINPKSPENFRKITEEKHDKDETVQNPHCCKCLLVKLFKRKRKSTEIKSITGNLRQSEQNCEDTVSPLSHRVRRNGTVTRPECIQLEKQNAKQDSADRLTVDSPSLGTNVKSNNPQNPDTEAMAESSELLSTEDRFSSVHSRLYRYSIAGDESCLSRQGSFSSCVQGHTTRRAGMDIVASREVMNGSTKKDGGGGRGVYRNRTLYFKRKKPLRSSVYSSCSNDSRRKHRRRQAERHLAYSGLIICLGFAVCVLPTSAIGVIQSIFNIRVSATVKFGVAVLSWIHAVVNPLLYGFLNPQYRIEFRRMLNQVTCRGRRRDPYTSSSFAGNRSSRSWHPASWWERRNQNKHSEVL